MNDRISNKYSIKYNSPENYKVYEGTVIEELSLCQYKVYVDILGRNIISDVSGKLSVIERDRPNVGDKVILETYIHEYEYGRITKIIHINR